MTMAQQLMQQGIKEGIQGAKLKVAKNMLQAGEPVSKISQFTELDIHPN